MRRPRHRSPRGPQASRFLGGAPYAYRPHARQAYQPARSWSANVVWRPQCPHVRVWNAGKSLPCWTMRSVTARRPSNGGGFVVRSIFTSVHLVGRWTTRCERRGLPGEPAWRLPSWRTSALRPGSESLGSDAPDRQAPAGRGSEVRATYPTPGCPNAQWDDRALQRTRRGTTAPPCTARRRTASALQREMMQ